MQQQTDSWLPQIGAKLRKKVYKTAALQQAVLKDDLTQDSTDTARADHLLDQQALNVTLNKALDDNNMDREKDTFSSTICTWIINKMHLISWINTRVIMGTLEQRFLLKFT